ncbi:hypothetical protein L211DRAFT_871349 [Terfezia boudieri ATCC MYA-4762]|uniref:Uncharacterized protein n=1 Tax=Terfezia boudieri ATCC MYA-4762 TaxID=1051890 RepID=A0A3N4LMX5_9PEZI|nr:hypothetical protein L211DRAFT_871349 [Terfezia boudieri ATCC MYA-4762]
MVDSSPPQTNEPGSQDSISALIHVNTRMIAQLSAIEARLHILESGAGSPSSTIRVTETERRTPARPTPERITPEPPTRAQSPIAQDSSFNNRDRTEQNVSLNIRQPDKFSGDRAELEDFLFHLEGYFLPGFRGAPHSPLNGIE